ncbi:SET domain-containing protein SmydA-8-like isoform X2 [Euwallacea similis]|uniref:SET domain-containing protein SmydA-8-like isoform X2 n=1 Tax=Euwallacea similis TaxID=1736056 RepID=UPI00344C147C
MRRCERTNTGLNETIKAFLKRHHLLDGNSPGWEIRQSDTGGFGVFATRDFDVGEVVFKDFPVIIGPRCIQKCPRICVCCFSKENLRICTSGCGLELCSQSCQNSSSHHRECKTVRKYLELNANFLEQFNQELFENLTPIRSLFLDEIDKEVVSCLIAHDRDDHGREIDTLKEKLGFKFNELDEQFLKFVCCVMDANAFEVALGNERCQSSVRGLYPLSSLANHSCVPNISHVFNSKHEMVVKAAVFIPKNSELFHCYTRLIWGSTIRLFHLHKTKHFVCKCPRCKDPTEFGTFVNSILCKLCGGPVCPVNPYKAYANWQCQHCKNITTGLEIEPITTLLGSILKGVESSDFPFMYNLLNGKLKSVVPQYNQVAVELKWKIVWVLGHKPGYTWSELTLDQLKIKEDICIDLLNLLEKLQCGQCKMRGLLLYELFCCKREGINRLNGTKYVVDPHKLSALLHEAIKILEHDVTAPQEIKNCSSSTNGWNLRLRDWD